MFRTEEQVKKLCKNCPFAKTANLLGDTVVLFILKEISSERKCFSDIEKSLSMVSSRTITEKLKFLEENDLLERAEEPGKPTRVFYSLSKKGQAFKKVESSLLSFGNEFFQSH